MASTSADRRGHVRGDSIATKRTRLTGSPRKGGVDIDLGAGAGGGSASRGGPGGAAAGQRSGASIPPRLAMRLVVGALALFCVLHFGPSLFGPSKPSARAVAAEAKHRKAHMAGAGESWILPRKWRDVTAGEGDVTLNGETLPECKRVLLFRFSDSHGFSSELMHYLRAMVIGSKLGYTVLADDSRWNFGAVTDYFLPRLVYCRPPPDWFSIDIATRMGTRRWQGQDRVWVSREMEREMDEWIRDEMLDPAVLEAMRRRQYGAVLPEGETLPAALEEAYGAFSSALREVWRPNHELAVLVRKQRMELGLGAGGLRHRKHSPTWGGNRRLGASDDAAADEDEDSDEYEYSVTERSDRGPVVGVHLAGEKPRVDLSLFGLDASQKVGNLSTLYEGVSDAVRRLTHASIRSPSYSRSRPNLFPPTATPTLIALTSNTTLFSLFSTDPNAVSYNVLRTSPPPYDDLLRFNDVLRLELTSTLHAPEGNANKLLREWDQRVWNADVPRALRVLLTRHFARDLSVLAQHADAFVVGAASPTGRLAVLLAGEDGAIGPRDFNGGGFGGRVRSVDAPWVPTAKLSAVFG
ncbi:hypothetical protein Rhopal_003598-T1 [Rhodotorula paludigena]|uniref:Proteophosphoglycan 5 n=1 Tax=Rhodotorula paludigena TaxID=86838 RepID=A0AAV5GDG9_9BASI|nr:hypothetical protein Rhopal_003598-T1 [Rhodotorula paludigena]